MPMELKMVNPHFESTEFTDGGRMYKLVFDGWDGIENCDEDGNIFWYVVTCEDTVYNYADEYAYGYSWFFEKFYEEYATRADFSYTEIRIVINAMLEAIKNGGI